MIRISPVRGVKRVARQVATALAFALLATTASAQVVDSGRTVLLPGQLDLAVQPGSFIPERCPVGPSVPLVEAPICIAFPRSAGSVDVQNAYGRALHAAGWRFTHGAANVLFFERASETSNCSKRLMMIGWLLGDEAEVSKYGTDNEPNMNWDLISHGTFIFVISQDDVCGEDRHVR